MDNRAYVASHFALEMDAPTGPKEMIGFLRSLEGGAMKADVQSWKSGNIPDVWKQLGRPKFEDLSLQVSMSLSKRFYDWIAKFFAREAERRTGSIIAADFNYTERLRRNWQDALISEVTIPALDAASKEAAHMTVKIAPEQMSEEKGSGKKINAKEHNAHKRWHCANFKFHIDGLGQGARITKIDSFTVKQQILEYRDGLTPYATRVAGMIEFPNLVVYMPINDAKPFIDLQRARLLGNAPPPQNRMTAGLSFLSHDLKTELAVINMRGVDVASVTHDKHDATSDNLYKVKVDLQVEGMTFEYDRVALE